MRLSYKTSLIFTVFVFCLFPLTTSANLLIHPIRVNLQPDQRSQTLTIANTSNVVSTYELSWRENIALTEGGYRVPEEDELGNIASVSSYVRFSPRRVTLQPGERQKVKLLLRRARNLEEGEYRSHLRFKAIPAANKSQAGKQRASSMRINVALNFSIPVTLTVGKYNSQVAVDGANIHYDSEKQAGQVVVAMSRQGPHSAWGDLSAYWTPQGGDEVLLAKSSNHSLWADLNQYKHKLVWAVEDFTPENGSLRVEYQGIKDFSHIQFANQVFKVNKDDISPLPTRAGGQQ